jgi:hypothetical protein
LHKQDQGGRPNGFLAAIRQAITSVVGGTALERGPARRERPLKPFRLLRKSQERQARWLQVNGLAGCVRPAAFWMGQPDKRF